MGGKNRGRQLNFANTPAVRPTPARVRETLFNWLQSIICGAHCLDLFAGSGILGIESASRGAASVDLVESNPQVAEKLHRCVEDIKLDKVRVHNLSAVRFLDKMNGKYDVVFLDPPYGEGLLENSCRILEKNALLADNAHIYMESEQRLTARDIPHKWKIVRAKKAGRVFYHLALR